MRKFLIVGMILLLGALFAGCRNSDNSSFFVLPEKGNAVEVTVLGRTGAAAEGVSVVLGDKNGSMRSSGTTDANGRITFRNAPADATITAANACIYSGLTDTTYSLDIKYDVSGPVEMNVDACVIGPVGPPAGNDAVLGTATVNVTNIAAGVTENRLYVGSIYSLSIGTMITQQTYSVRSRDLNSNGNILFATVGYDAGGKAIAYDLVTDQTFTDNMTVDLSLNKALSHIQYDITNIPAETISIYPSIFQWKGPGEDVGLGDWQGVSSYPSSTTLSVPYIPGFGTTYIYSVSTSLDFNDNGWGESDQYLSFYSSAGPPADQTIDLSLALKAPHNFTVAYEGTATPTLSWTGTDARASERYLLVDLQLSSGADSQLELDLSNDRTSVTFPELPDSLAAFRPVSVESFSVYYYLIGSMSYAVSSGRYSKYFNWSPQRIGKIRADAELAAMQRGKLIRPPDFVR